MASHRLEKVARSIQATVGEVIQNQLSDPRIKGLISVTRVDPAPDLRSARVYISILGVDENQQQLSLRGIEHARGHIQHLLARQVAFKMCPTLQFYLDESLKKGFKIIQLLDELSAEEGEGVTESESNLSEESTESDYER